ncbi:MAG: c-type cytochrome [Rhizomicrobium sp.]
MLRCVAAGTLFLVLSASGAADAYPRQADIARGHYLAIASDCMSCHTDANHPPFSGNRAVPTPFGSIWSSNITPDRETGIGEWTERDFYRALHDGLGKDGRHLYPAMPYPWYTKLPRADVDAIFAYLKTLPEISSRTRTPALPWPLSWRFSMTFWDWLFFHEADYKPDVHRDAQWNRGAFLAEGPGHCGACHTPKNFLGASTGAFLHGGVFDSWFAPMLAANPRDGLGSWTGADLVRFLKTGRNAKTAAFGPMSEVVADSTRYMTDGDLAAIATFLKSQGTVHESSPPTPKDDVMRAGGQIFAAQCSACHQAGGQGERFEFASLRGSANAQSRNPDTVIRAILTGVRAVSTARRPTGFSMPAFDWKLNDAQIAAVATYIGNAWGNAAPAVSAGAVGSLRKAVQAKSSVVPAQR